MHAKQGCRETVQRGVRGTNFPVQPTLLPPAPYLGAELTLLLYSAFASLPWPGFPLRSSLGTTGPGGRIEKHVRVPSISGRHLWFGTRGRFPWRGHRQAALSWVLPGSRGAVSLQPLHPVLSRLRFITLQPSSFRPSSFMFAEGLTIMFY